MMVAVTVTLGVFVSCKDTNEDLYRDLDLRLQEIESSATVPEAMQKQLDNLKKQLEEYKALLDQIKSCDCDCDAMSKLIKDMQQAIKDLQAAQVDPATWASMQDAVKTLTDNYATVYNFVTNVGVSKDELAEAVKMLEDKIAEIKQCECDLSKLAEIEKTASDALALAKDAASRIEEVKKTADDAAAAAKTAADDAKTALDNAKAALEAAQAAATDANTAKELAEAAKKVADDAKQLAEDAKDIADAADKLSKANAEAIGKIELQLVSMSDSLKHAYETADKAWAQATGNKKSIDSLAAVVKADREIIDEMKKEVEKIPGLEKSIADLYNKVDSLGKEIEDLKPEITKLYEYSDANLEKAKAYTDLEIALVRADIANINIDIFNLREDLNGAIDEIEAVKDAVDEINDSLDKLDDRVTENATKIGEVEEKLAQAEKDFQDKIDALQDEIDELTGRVEKNEKDIADILGQLDELRNNLAKQVTGIIVQGTVNPAFGTVNLPFNIQSNVLLAYYGEADHDIVFPTNDPTYYVDDRFVLSWKDLYLLGMNGKEPIFKSGDVIMQNDEYNAGTLYLTVNPNTVNFEDLKLTLVNSQEEESYVKLGELKRSDKKLELGYSRAADNGFYECYAKVNPEDVKKVQKISINASGLKDDIKAVVKNHTASDLQGLAIDLAGVVKSMKLDANGVKCEWEDVDGQKHAVYSNYNIAATAVEPLSLESYKDFNFKKVPGYDYAVKYINKAVNKIKNDVHVVMTKAYEKPVVKKIQNLKINKLQIIEDFDNKTVHDFNISKKVEIDGVEYSLGVMDVTVPVKWTDGSFDLTTLDAAPCLVISGTDNTATVVVPVKASDETVVGYATLSSANIIVQPSSTPDAVDVVIGNHSITVNKNTATNFKMSELINFDATTVTVKVDMSKEVYDLWEKYQDEFDNLNESLGQLKAIVEDINSMLDEWDHYEEKIDDMIYDYRDKVMSIVNKVNTKLVNFINNTNLRMQPILIASDDKGAKVLSEAKEYPSVMGKDLNFIATTWNLELLAPMAKKHVAVTDVINGDKSAKGDDATCLAELKRVNSSSAMNAVLPGDINRAYATDLKSGYIYEVAYSALDFHGKIATRKYYIKIK